MYGDNVVAAPVSYIISYFGDNITSESIIVSVTRAKVDLPAVDSDVNVFVTAMNVFGTGGNSEVLRYDISELTTYIYAHTYCMYGMLPVWVYMLLCIPVHGQIKEAHWVIKKI